MDYDRQLNIIIFSAGTAVSLFGIGLSIWFRYRPRDRRPQEPAGALEAGTMEADVARIATAEDGGLVQRQLRRNFLARLSNQVAEIKLRATQAGLS